MARTFSSLSTQLNTNAAAVATAAGGGVTTAEIQGLAVFLNACANNTPGAAGLIGLRSDSNVAKELLPG